MEERVRGRRRSQRFKTETETERSSLSYDSAAQHNTEHNSAQHSAAQHSTEHTSAQHSTAQSTAHKEQRHSAALFVHCSALFNSSLFLDAATVIHNGREAHTNMAATMAWRGLFGLFGGVKVRGV